MSDTTVFQAEAACQSAFMIGPIGYYHWIVLLDDAVQFYPGYVI